MDFTTLLQAFSAERRLYRLEAPETPALATLMVEAWAERETLNAPWSLEVIALGQDASLDLSACIGQPLSLMTRLADGSEQKRNALLLGADFEEADGGLCRYRLQLGSWLSLLDRGQHAQVWQERPLTELIDSLLAQYSPHAQWRWADCVSEHLARSPWSNAAGQRPLVVQHQQSDLALLQRLLREEGLVLRFERSTDTVVLLADTTREANCPALPEQVVRFHRDDATEPGDTVQALGSQRLLPTFTLTALASQHGAAASTAASTPSLADGWGPSSPRIEAYLHLGEVAWGQEGQGMTGAQADRALSLAQAGWEVQHKRFIGRSTVRSLHAGLRFELQGSALDAELPLKGNDPAQRTLLASSVAHVGINNLPKGLSAQIAGLTGFKASKDTNPHAEVLPPWVGPELRRQAAKSGYANAFSAHRALIPWHPAWWAMGALAGVAEESFDELSPLLPAVALPALTPLHAKARHVGQLTATVVDAQGAAEPRDAAVQGDGLGRIRVRLDVQGALPSADGTSLSSVWVRVAQAWAGAGVGSQFMPRLGQQVLLDFVNGDLEQPIVVGSLYDGRGEGALAATPGGEAGSEDRKPFGLSDDHRPSAQGNLASGHGPAWHGASPEALDQEGQRNAAALSGFKSQEWDGGSGYSQLVMDDSDAEGSQLRVQLSTTAHGTQLNLGHLIHQADNHRGSFRGLGFELRSDGYASLRAGQGLLLSTATAQATSPAGDNAPGLALAKQLVQLASTFSQGAGTHQLPTLAASQGSHKASSSLQCDTEAPAQALLTAFEGLVEGKDWEGALSDAASRNTAGDKLPHTVAPVLALQGQGGLVEVAGQDHVQAAGHTILEAAGQQFDQAVGGDWRVQAGQALGMLGGAIKAGTGSSGTGLTAIAGSKDVMVQAQSDVMKVHASKDITVGSQSANVDWAAAKSITLAVSGGASITIQSGNITLMAPGKITVKAVVKKLLGAATQSYGFPSFPKAEMPKRKLMFDMALADTPGPKGHPLTFTPWAIVRSLSMPEGLALLEPKQLVTSGESDDQGKVKLSVAQQEMVAEAYCSSPGGTWLVYPGQAVLLNVAQEQDSWTQAERAFNALSAADFSVDVHGHHGSEGALNELRYAKKATDANGDSELPNKLKGG